MGRRLTSGPRSCGASAEGSLCPSSQRRTGGAPASASHRKLLPALVRSLPPSGPPSAAGVVFVAAAAPMKFYNAGAAGGRRRPTPPPPALASALLPPHRASATPPPYPLLPPGGRGRGGGVRPGVGGAHGHPRGPKGRAGQRALPPASQPAAVPWQRLPGWTRQRSASAQGWRGERRMTADTGSKSLEPRIGRRGWCRSIPPHSLKARCSGIWKSNRRVMQSARAQSTHSHSIRAQGGCQKLVKLSGPILLASVLVECPVRLFLY